VTSGVQVPTREDAWNLLCEWTTGEPLRKHGRAVEAAVDGRLDLPAHGLEEREGDER